MQTSLIALLCLVAVVLWRLVASRHRKTQVSLVTGPKPSSAILGSLIDFQTGGSAAWHKEYGPVVRYKGWLGEDRLSLIDPTAIAHVLTAGPYTWDRELSSKPRMGLMFGDGLLNSVGEKHKRFRASMGPAFNAPAVHELLPIFKSKAEELKERWESECLKQGGSAIVQATDDLGLATVNVIGEAACGYQFDGFNAGLANPLLRAFAVISSTVGHRSYPNVFMENLVDALPHSFYRAIISLPFGPPRLVADAIRTLNAYSEKLFHLALDDSTNADKAAPKRDLLSVLVRANASDSAKRRLSDEEVQTSMVTLFQTSFSSTSQIPLTTIWSLAENPEIQFKLREELNSELGEEGPYLDAVFREGVRTSRLASIAREAMEDTVLPLGRPMVLSDGRTVQQLAIRKGQLVDIPLTSFNTDQARLGSDADRFEPERYIDERRERFHDWRAGSDDGILIFGFGVRACMGWRFATLEMKTMLATLVRRFEFTLEDPEAEISQLRVTLTKS